MGGRMVHLRARASYRSTLARYCTSSP
jgi:hypothetical protein